MNGIENVHELTTERIRSRMLKNAARIWGVESEDIESSFDPLVTMMIEACAAELNKINGEIISSQTRILNRLAKILSPEALTGPHPAHAIAHARSIEPACDLATDNQFYSVKKISALGAAQREINKDIFFSPCIQTRLFDGDVKYVACNNMFYEYKSPSSRQLISDGPGTSYLEPSQMWIGVEMNSKISSLDKLSFYFDWKNDPEQETYLHMLPLTQWSLNKKPLNIREGFPGSNSAAAQGSASLADQYDSTLKIEEFITAYYQNQFYSISADEGNDSMDISRVTYPKELEEVFSSTVLSKIQGNYLWFKLQFTTAFPLNAISDLYVSINCFPVVNRHLNKFTYRLQNTLNIVPLATEELFQDLISISTSEGKSFMSNPMGTGFHNEAGFYTLRYGGVERFDDRQSVELLNNVIELLRDESAAFSSLGNDFISSYIRQINQSIAMIENRLDMKGQKSKPGHFLLVNPYTQDENIFVSFWSTNGNIANQIKSGSKLLAYSGAETRSDSLMLMTTTSGGKDSLNENERITAYKKALLTHDRVITEQDIRNYCLHELGSLIRNVSIRKGWEVVNKRNQGIRRVMEVVLSPARNHSLNDEEWSNLARELNVKLELQSSTFLPVKVLVEAN